MQVFIAEKSSVGRAVVDYMNRNCGCKLKNVPGAAVDSAKDLVVTWAQGHLLEDIFPDKYTDMSWAANKKEVLIFPPEDLPRKQVNKEKKDQYDIVMKYIANANVIVNCGDPDREGQILVDELLDIERKEHPKHHFTVKRMLLNALDDTSIKKALESIEDNEKYHGLYEAGMARDAIDYIIGMSATRYYSNELRSRGFSLDKRLPVGRVTSPKLNLIVKRELEIKNFKKQPFYKIEALLDVGGETVRTALVTEDRITDKAKAQAIAKELNGGKAVVQEVEKASTKEIVKTLYSLDNLQTDASRYYDISPADTLDALEQLYINKYTSYPRSDCKYLPKSQFADAGKIITELNRSGLLKTEIPMPGAKMPAVYNDSKITAHHAVVPTGTIPPEGKLNDTQAKVYLLIAKKYASIFMNPYAYTTQNVTFNAGDKYTLGLKSKQVEDLGWKTLYKDVKADDAPEEAPEVKHEFAKLDTFPIKEAVLKEAETQPPKRYTEGSIITTMNNVKGESEEASAKLKEVKGIGTPATRATILQNLLDKNLIKKEKKVLVPTKMGILLVKALEERIKKPDFTADMELMLDDVQNGKRPMLDVIEEARKFVKDIVGKPLADDICNEATLCPKCGKGHLMFHEFRNKEDKSVDRVFICNNPECKMRFPEGKKNQPKIVKCPECGKGWIVPKKSKFGIFYACTNYPACNKKMKEDEWKKQK